MIELFLKGKPDTYRLILPLSKQIKSWHKANRKMAWGIPKVDFNRIEAPLN